MTDKTEEGYCATAPKSPSCSWSTFLSVVGLMAALSATIGSQMLTYSRRADPGPRLHDVFLDQSYVSYSHWWADSIAMLFVASVLGCVVVRARGFVLLRHFCSLLSIAYLLRSITLPLTSLPDPSDACQGADPEPSGIGVSMCNGLIFSGHTSLLIVSSFVLLDAADFFMVQQDDKSPRCRRFLVVSMVSTACTVGVLGLLYARMHYTIDVVIAILVCFPLCIAYYHRIRSAKRILRSRFWTFWEGDLFSLPDTADEHSPVPTTEL
jgi:hypothetical protein